MSKKEDEQYGSNSAAAASVNSSKSKSGSGFSSFSQSNGVQNSGSFQTSQEAAKNNANSSIASVSYTSAPNISASGFSSLSSKSTNPSFSQGQSSDGENFGNATSVQSVSVPENASFAPVQLETNQANLFQSKLSETANALGITPVELATLVSFETGGTFDPLQVGPTTKWGTHRGVIQFGEPQAKRFGADFSSAEAAINSQFGEDGAIVKYAKAHGYEKGMGARQLYSAINAGGINRFNASDTGAGGTWGTVGDKLDHQMTDHRAKAERLFGDTSTDIWADTRQYASNKVGLPSGDDIPTPALQEDQNATLSTAMAYTAPETDQNIPFDAALTEKDTGLGLAALTRSKPSIQFARAEQADVKPELKAVLNSISSATGQEILVNSGYRSPEYNKKVGGAKKSAHVEKIAADIDMTGMDNSTRTKVVETAIDAGAKRFITYDSMPNVLHIDMRGNDLAFMHNKSAKNINSAPDWFQQIASGGKASQPSKFSQNAAMPSVPNPTSANVEQSPKNVQTPTERVDKYTSPPETAEQPQELTGKQKFMAGVIDVGSSFIPGAGTAIGIANGVASMTGNKTLGQRLVSSKGFGVGTSTLDYGQGETSDYAEIEKQRRLEAERLAAEEVTAVATPSQSIDRYLTASNDTWRPNANERFGTNANNYR